MANSQTPLQVGPEEARRLLECYPPDHGLVAILRAVLAGLVTLQMVVPSSEPFTLRESTGVIFIDDGDLTLEELDFAGGPGAYDQRSLSRLFEGASQVLINAGDFTSVIGGLASGAGSLLGRCVLVDTTEVHISEWVEYCAERRALERCSIFADPNDLTPKAKAKLNDFTFLDVFKKAGR